VISATGVSVLVVSWYGVGNNRCWAAPGPHASEAGVGSAGPAGMNSARGQ
jgi:hypothetical protein